MAAALCLWTWALAAAAPPPIAYRCDALKMARAPEGGTCEGRVVLRRDALFLCCQRLRGEADGKGGWRAFVCEGDVRGQAGPVAIWSEHARFDVGASELTLTGRPLAVRDGSALAGRRIVVHTEDDTMEVEAPRGQLATDAAMGPTQAPLPAMAPGAALPATCPLAPRPQGLPPGIVPP